MKSVIFVLVISILMSFHSATVIADELEILTEDYPPYNYQSDEGVTGFSTEVVRAILESIGQEHLQIKLQPWARAYRTVKTKPNVMLYTTARTPEREKDFKWVGPISDRKIWLYKLKSRQDIQVNSLEDAKKYVITGVTDSAIMHFLIDEHGFVVGKHIDLTWKEELSLRKFLKGRADLINKVPMGMASGLRTLGRSMDLVEPLILVTGNLSYYLAFSLGTPDNTIKQWQKALDQLKENGTYNRIKATYMQ